MKKRLTALLILLLCLSLLPLSAAAEDASLLDQSEMQAMLDEYIASHKLNPEKLSIGYIYTETGDTFYYNEDTWYYSASMYKVPVMMLLAEKEAKGELERDSKVMGLKLGYAEETILTYSNNEYAHMMMAALAPSEPDCRDLYKQFASLPDDYYISDFRDYSYFTARFMTEVMQTLYSEPERFPNIIDCLLNAQLEHYFRLRLPGVQIAQKYGSYKDYMSRDFNHTTGILYLPHPIILTVMTQDAPGPETVIADLAKLFADYTTETVDARLEAYEAQRLAAEEAERLEAERKAAEEAERLAAEAEPEPSEEPSPEPTAEATPEPVETGLPEQAAPDTRLFILIGAGLLLVLNLLVLALRRRR